MKRLLLAVIIGLMFLASQNTPEPSSVVQSSDIIPVDLQTQSQRELWVFTADWCPSCKDYEITLKEAEKQGVKIKRIDYDRHPDLVKKYKIRVVPTTLVMEDGDEMEREEGSLSFSQIFELLKTTARTLLANIFNLILVSI